MSDGQIAALREIRPADYMAPAMRADTVIAVDAPNPQIATGLAPGGAIVRRVRPRQASMKAALHGCATSTG